MKIQLATLVAAVAVTGVASAAVINLDPGTTPANNAATGQAIQTFTTVAGGEVGFLNIHGGDRPGTGELLGAFVQIREVTAGGLTGDATVTLGAILDEAGPVDQADDGDGTQFATWDFGGDVTLAAGTLYAMTWSTTSGAAPESGRTGLNGGGDPYAGGGLFDANGNQMFGGGFDVAFEFTDVPEPGSLALLGLGGLALLRRRRA